jgi:hypothetical protein
MQSRFDLKYFDIATLKPHCIMMLLGKRNTGKSVLAKFVLANFPHKFDYGIAFTPTESSAAMFAEFMPRSCIYDAMRPDVLETMMAHQRAAGDKKRSLFCVLDDCMYDKAAMRDKAVRDVFMNGRHQKITLILTSQYLMDLTPDLRNNVDYAFCLRDNVVSSRTKLYSAFFGIVPTYAEFAKIMLAATESHGAIVFDNTNPTNCVSDCIFWYRASVVTSECFLGRRTFYRMCARHELSPGKTRPQIKSSGTVINLIQKNTHASDDDDDEEMLDN